MLRAGRVVRVSGGVAAARAARSELTWQKACLLREKPVAQLVRLFMSQQARNSFQDGRGMRRIRFAVVDV